MTEFVEGLKLVGCVVLAVLVVMAGIQLALASRGTTYRPRGKPKNPVSPSRRPLEYYSIQARLAEGKRFDPLAVDEEIWVPYRDWVCDFCGRSMWNKDGTCVNCGAPRKA